MCRSHRQTGFDSEGPWDRRARPAGTGPAPGPWPGQHCACWDPEARSPSATSHLRLWHIPAELGSRPASRRDGQPTPGSCAVGSGSRVLPGESGLLEDQVQDASGNRKSMRPQPSKLLLGCPGTTCTQGWGRCNELGRAVSATGRGLRAATEAWAGSALADARPRALSTDKAPSPRPGHPQPACGSVEGLWLGCSRHSGQPLPGCRHLILLVARALERS